MRLPRFFTPQFYKLVGALIIAAAVIYMVTQYG